MKKVKEIIKHKLLEYLGIEYQILPRLDPINKIDELERGTGIGYIRWTRFGEYLGEDGSILDRLLKLEKKVYKKK